MADKAWKQFERDMAKLIGGKRFWANSGESIDIEGPVFLGQCKHVAKMSLNAIAELGEKAAKDGRDHTTPVSNIKRVIYAKDNGDTGFSSETELSREPNPKLGIACFRTKPGRGKKAKTIVVMDESVFKELFPTGNGG